MAISESGRVVLEVDPGLKRKLYSALALEHKSLKEWFILMAEEYIKEQQQPRLFGSSKEEPGQ
jgi:hypothetical protein